MITWLRRVLFGPYRLWLFDDGERHWISAASLDDAYLVYLDCYGADGVDAITECRLTVAPVFPLKRVRVVMDDGTVQTKMAYRWCKRDGRGLIASSVF
ncbi:MAG: hypothetical protein A2W31_05130 [Planctomycetes bacterium RBG_16_64_10]|nr:MAG: hypothetical protein A2W31_05130 [Planctomycetes bacterium RBG_16_64_10]